MKDLSLHILDIAQNSIAAHASIIEIVYDENALAGIISLVISDNGCGMDEKMLKKAADPYVTSRTTRSVGLGLSLLKQNAERCDGFFNIESQVGVGTSVFATFALSNIDTPPMGDLAGVVALLITGNPTVDFIFTCSLNGRNYNIDSREIKSALGKVPASEPSVFILLKDMIKANVNELRGVEN